MTQILFILLLASAIVLVELSPMAAGAVSGTAPCPVPAPRPGCPCMCGKVHIPFPFGIGDDCSWKPGFTVSCSGSKPYYGNLEISNISLEAGEMRVFGPVSYVCYNSSKTTESSGKVSTYLNLTCTPFMISPTRNEFTAIGCSTLAVLKGRKKGWSYYTGCITSCVSSELAAHDGDKCTGLGCCQTSISGNLTLLNLRWNDGKPFNPAWEYSPCSYAFVAEKGWYNFSRRDALARFDANDSFAKRVGVGTETIVPLVLDWAMKNGFCGADSTADACISAHSHCVNATHGPGYLCNCSKGNPYVINGCTNINECDIQNSNSTVYPCATGSTCQDTEGDYNCKCKFLHRGDGKSEKGCQPIIPPSAIIILVTSIAGVLACFVITLLLRRRQRKLFNKNGGDILKDVGIKIFSKGQLKKITNGYRKLIGEGAFGKVYKGTIDGTEQVAVKCSVARRVAPKQRMLRGEAAQQDQESLRKEAFVKEITFQFKVQHANVVRLIGCCLETDVPILIFEYVPKGSLYDMLHCDGGKRTLSLLERLDIAIGSAEALSFIHTSGKHNHVHGDVKSANILLNEKLVPKVSDFGSSKLLSVDGYARAVVADRSYIDPVYMKTNHFTEKSDVYSFGVVLLELITRKKAMYGGNNSLPIDFVKHHKEKGNGREMYDKGILSGDALRDCHMGCLDKIGTLAVRCLKEDVDERPTMAEVVEELNQVRFTAHSAEAELPGQIGGKYVDQT